MRIGIDARILQDELRGQGQYVYYLIKHLGQLSGDNEYVAFYNGIRGRLKSAGLESPRVKHVWSRFPGTLLWQSWSKLSFPPVEYFIGNIDVFHNTFNFNFTNYTPIPSKARMVATFNGMTDPSHIWRGRSDFSQVYRWFDIIASKASMIIAVSNSVKEDLLSRVKVEEERIRVIYYGVSDSFRPIQDKAAIEGVLSKHGLSGKRYILYVGASEKNKNLSGLLKAFAIVRKSKEDIKLVLAGKIDPGYRIIMEESKMLGLSDSVIFTGYVSHEELPFMYNGACLFVLPTFHEWFGIPLIEAMACGVPVVAANCRGIPEVVGDSAILFDPYKPQAIADSIIAVLENEKLGDSLRVKGINRASGFTWQKTAEKTLEVYKKVVKA